METLAKRGVSGAGASPPLATVDAEDLSTDGGCRWSRARSMSNCLPAQARHTAKGEPAGARQRARSAGPRLRAPHWGRTSERVKGRRATPASRFLSRRG